MPEPLITILTPFKNTESFIEECVQSIINQSYTNWEAIFVADNSTDKSLNIMETFTPKEKRIKLFYCWPAIELYELYEDWQKNRSRNTES